MTPKIKICGITEQAHLDLLAELKCDFVGFMFCENSPRYLTLEQARALAQHTDPSIKKVAIVADAPDQTLATIIEAVKPDYLQLHGKETPARLAEIKQQTGTKIIKALGIATPNDLAPIKDYAMADIILLDAKGTGGMGETFDWSLLQGADLLNSWMLSGGLSPDNVKDAIKQVSPPMVDVSSGVESTRGKKSSEKIAQFISAVRS